MTAQFLVQWDKRAVTHRAYRTKWDKSSIPTAPDWKFRNNNSALAIVLVNPIDRINLG